MPRYARALFAAAVAVLVAGVVSLAIEISDDEPDTAGPEPTQDPTALPDDGDGATTGGTTDGADTTDGETTDGGATDGGATDGGATDGDTTDGGATDGDTTDGGATDGTVDDMPETGGGAIVAVAGLVTLGGAALLTRRRPAQPRREGTGSQRPR